MHRLGIKLIMAAAGALAAIMAAGCGWDVEEVGGDGQGCYPNGSCNKGYVCTSDKICASGSADGDADATEIPCNCSSGLCCADGCRLDSSGHVCSTKKEYRCTETGVCDGDIQVREQKQYCSGSSSECDGRIADWGDWKKFKDCTAYQVCAPNETTAGEYVCAPKRVECNDPTWCETGSGPCCRDDTNTLYTNSRVCSVAAETYRGCPDGSVCGGALKMRVRDWYCDGVSTACNGSVHGAWSAWLAAETCLTHAICTDTNDGAASCVLNRAACDSMYYCNDSSEPCCDTGSAKLFTSAVICDQNIEVELGCPMGSACGQDSYINTTSRYCSGTDGDCTGDLKNSGWVKFKDCASNQWCDPDIGFCVDHTFHDLKKCDGLKWRWYNNCDVAEDVIEDCDDADPCTTDACDPTQGCSNTPNGGC